MAKICFQLVVLLVLALATDARGAWRPPLDGAAIAAPFHYSVDTPFLAGQRRGVDLRASQPSVVLAACSGAVRHAGALPSGRIGVSLSCGPWVATELGLDRVLVRAGGRVRAGAAVGTIAAGGVLRLGARRAADPFGYVDPLRLIRVPHSPPSLIPAAPQARMPRSRIPSPARRPGTQTRQGSPDRVPLPALLGAALLLAALLIPARRRRPDSLRTQHGLLRHYADLLRQRRAAPRARVHHDRRRRARAPSPSAWGGRLLPDRHR